MSRTARRALSALTATVLLAGLMAGTPSAARAGAVEPSTQYVAVAGNTYVGAHAADCNSTTFKADSADDNEEVDSAVTAADGGTVYFCAGNYYFTDTVLSSDIEYVGAGATSTSISGGDSTRIFGADGNVVVSGLTLRNAYSSDEGGAIAAAGTVEITDAILKDNFTLKGGGAIAAGGTITVTDSVFTGNSTTDRGGAIATYGYVTVHSSTFTNNSSIADENCVGGGGAIAAGDDVYVDEGSTFTGNTAVIGEGTDVDLCDNEDIYGGRGGAILTGEFGLIYDSRFSGNSAPFGGGAIYALGAGFLPTRDLNGVIEGSTFVNNTMLSTFTDNIGFDGGNAVYQRSDDLHISESSFLNNTGLGSAVQVVGDYIGGAAVVTDSTFSGNTGIYGGAIGAVYVSVSGSTFNRNSAEWSGGAITAVNAEIDRSTFAGNSSLRGGAVFYCGESFITNSSFTQNVAERVSNSRVGPAELSGLGGAVAGYGGTLSLTSNTFTSNRADLAGGAVWLEDNAGESLAVMSKNRFTRNQAGSIGGAVGYALNTGSVPSRSELRAAQRQNRFSGNRGGRGALFGGFVVPDFR